MDTTELLKISRTYGTPLYVYDGDIVRLRYRELCSFFPYPQLTIHYAMKANYNPAILKILFEEGCAIDAVSLGEVLLAKKVGFPADRILFTANMITDEEMRRVHDEGVLLNVDSLSRLEKFGLAYPGSHVVIRLNPGIGAGHHDFVKTGGDETKFGIRLNEVPAAVEVVRQFNLNVVGIHEHAGSGIPESVQMMEGMRAILDVITRDDFPHLQFVDFGGGFKVPYRPGEKRVDYAAFGRDVVALFVDFCKEYGRELEMHFEPGRYLVGEAGKLLVEVNTLKNNNGRRIAGVNSGFPQLIRPMLYSAYHHIVNLSNISGQDTKYDIVGNICETGDHFAKDRVLGEIREGDILAIENAGAYCYSMGGVYNLRSMPAEVVVENGKGVLVTPRKTEEQLVSDLFSVEYPNLK